MATTAPNSDTSENKAALATGSWENEQASLVAFLSDSENWSGQTVERIDTHISRVFLVGERVYKLKRAVTLEFLDFSSLENRRQACEREVALNKKTAPDIYLRTVPVAKSGGKFEIDGKGEPVDWLVEMRRFDQTALFNHLVATKALGEGLICDLGEQIARFHLGAEATARYGGRQAVKATLESIYATLKRFETDIFEPAALLAWRQKAGQSIEDNGEVLEVRRQSGFVRQCHGDLHLGNICLYKGRPTLFDAIEFREDFSNTDVLYDIAFPVMDLLRHKRPQLANLLMNRYLEVTGDYAGLSVLPLFLSMRGMVRAMVHALEAQHSEDAETHRETAKEYFAKAIELLEPQSPRLVAFGGYSGSGKSSVARHLATQLAKEPGAIVLRSDAVRKRLFHHAILVPLPKHAYTEEVSTRVYRAMFRDAHRALSAGWVVFVDATFIEPDRRTIMSNFAEKKGVPFQGLWLEAPKEVLIARVNARTGDVSDATSNVVEMQMARSPEPIDWARIDTQGAFEATVERAFKALTE